MDPTQLPLRDLHLPDAVGWWPLAPGWWYLIFVTVGISIGMFVRFLDRRQIDGPRRFALHELALFESQYLQHNNAVLLAKQVSELLRRTMLAYAPRDTVAGLTGEAWLQWLDKGLSVPYFHTEGGKSLLSLPYRDPDADHGDVDINAMLAAVRMRLTTPPGGTS